MNNGSPDVAHLKENLIKQLKKEGILRSRSVEEAFRAIRREDFLPLGEPEFVAYFDEPIPLGSSGQTISAPHMVVIMLEELELFPGSRVLEIGTGSGYNAALLAHVVSQGITDAKDLVVSVERVDRLAYSATANLLKAGLSRIVKVISGDGSLGYPQEEDREIYDRILVTAASKRVPVFLKKQLKKEGIILIPLGGNTFQMLTKLKKKKEKFEEKKLTECMFVPLVGEGA